MMLETLRSDIRLENVSPLVEVFRKVLDGHNAYCVNTETKPLCAPYAYHECMLRHLTILFSLFRYNAIFMEL